jgi:hypothetical protein
METIAKRELRERTWERNRTLWVSFEWGGLLCPLAAEQKVLNDLGRAGVANPMAIADENWRVKEYQVKRSNEVDQAVVNQERLIADMKVETGLVKLAIEQATNDYVLTADFYSAKVRSLLMGTQEFAAAVELKMLAVEASEVTLFIAKEALHLQDVEDKIIEEGIAQQFVATDIAKNQIVAQEAIVKAAEAQVGAGEAEVKVEEADLAIAKEELRLEAVQDDIIKESINQAFLQTDIAKIVLKAQKAMFRAAEAEVAAGEAEVEVEKTTLAINQEAVHLQEVQANIVKESINQQFIVTEIVKINLEALKAAVRAAMAGVEAGETEVKAEEAQVEIAMTTAQKAELQAQVAELFVKVLMIQLEAIKLDIGTQEIQAGFGFLQSKLDDMIQQYDTDTLIENLKLAAEQAIAKILPQLLTDGETAEDLRNTAMDNEQAAFTYKDTQTQIELGEEATLQGTLVAAKERMMDENLYYFQGEQDKETWAKELLEAARIATYAGMTRWDYTTLNETEFIS